MKKLFAILFLTFGIAQAQTHNYKFILSSGPGSGSDVTLDIYSACLKNQKIIVSKEYKPGAEGLVAIKALQQSQDTDNQVSILLGNFGLNVLGKFPNIDLLTDINPITYINSTPMVIVTRPGKYKSLEDAINASKVKALNIGQSSVSGTFIAGNLFKDLHVPHQLIPYRNSINGLTDVINGNLDLFVDTYIGAKPLIEVDRLAILTSTFDKQTSKRLGHDPISKYNKELGQMPLGLILSVQPNADKSIRNMIIKSFETCGKDPEIIKKLELNNSQPLFVSTEEIVKMIKFVNGK